MKKTIWTPRLYETYDFGIILNRDFANDMLESKVSDYKQSRMNFLGNEVLKKQGITWNNPYKFYDGTCFISQIYIGQNGVLLSTNDQTIDSLVKKKGSSDIIEYNSHNVDTSKYAYVLMKLFNTWIENSAAFKSKE